MKNKTLVILFCIIFFFSNFNKLLSDDFIFESTSIEINKEENIVIAKDGVLINSNDNLEITSDRASYFKEKKLLKLRGNVIIKDNNQNIIIRSENIDYEKNIEKIISKNDTKIDIEDDFIIEGKNINFFRLEKIVKSKDPVKLTDKFKNKINAINFDYEIEKKRFISNQMTFTDQN